MNTTSTPTPENGVTLLSNNEGPEEIYATVYKKGYSMGTIHFKFKGGLTLAVEAIKAYLAKRHLKHIHTVPFLVDLNADENNDSSQIN